MGLDCHCVPAIYSSDCLGDVSPGQALLAQLGFLTREVQAWGRRDDVVAMKSLKALPVKVGLLYTSSSSSRTFFGASADLAQELLCSIRADSAFKQPAQIFGQSPNLLSGSGLHYHHQDGSSNVM